MKTFLTITPASSQWGKGGSFHFPKDYLSRPLDGGDVFLYTSEVLAIGLWLESSSSFVCTVMWLWRQRSISGLRRATASSHFFSSTSKALPQQPLFGLVAIKNTDRLRPPTRIFFCVSYIEARPDMQSNERTRLAALERDFFERYTR